MMSVAETIAPFLTQFMFHFQRPNLSDKPWRWMVSSIIVMPTMLETTPAMMKKS